MSLTVEIPIDFLKEMANFEFPPSTQKKLDQLMEKNNEGKITEAEKADLQALVELNEKVSVVKARANLMLSKNA